jgi:hypothetical protein
MGTDYDDNLELNKRERERRAETGTPDPPARPGAPQAATPAAEEGGDE